MHTQEDFAYRKLKSLRISTKCMKRNACQLAFENTDDKEVEEITETYTCTIID